MSNLALLRSILELKEWKGGGGGSADAKKQLADFSTHSHFTRHFRRIITEIQSFNTVLPTVNIRNVFTTTVCILE